LDPHTVCYTITHWRPRASARPQRKSACQLLFYIPGIFVWVVRFSKIQQLLETYLGNFLARHLSPFWNFRNFWLNWKYPRRDYRSSNNLMKPFSFSPFCGCQLSSNYLFVWFALFGFRCLRPQPRFPRRQSSLLGPSKVTSYTR